VRLARIDQLRGAADPGRLPAFLRGGALRLLAVCLVIWAIEMLPLHLSPTGAGRLVLAGLLITVGGGVAFAAGTRRLLTGLEVPFLSAGVARAEAILLLLRRIGLLLVGLAFVLFWTFVYVGVWWWDPVNAFTGLGHRPRFADFFYTAVSTAFISPPGDILAHTRGARAATMTEMLTGAALLTAYLSSFADWGSEAPEPDRGEPPTGPPR
jgi:hypothetical protein